MRRQGARFFAFAVFGLAASSPAPAGTYTVPQAMEVNCRAFSHFRIGYDSMRFGALTFVGGLEMTSPDENFGSFSSFRFRSPGDEFIGVTDTGFWFFGRIDRDAERRPICFSDFKMQRFVDAEGEAVEEKSLSDAEGIAFRDGIATVSFERTHRISEYMASNDGMGPPRRDLPFLVPAYELRSNKGFETVAYAPEEGPLSGARVVVTERSIDEAGNSFAAILEGPEKGIFTVARHDDFDITDGAFLPDGDLLVLERRYSPISGIAMRLRRIAAETIRSGAVADGPVLLSADMGYEIDNIEGLDLWRRADGATVVSLISDDNQFFLQRNIYLEFVLTGD